MYDDMVTSDILCDTPVTDDRRASKTMVPIIAAITR